MRAELTIAKCGFALRVNDYDVALNERVLFHFLIFWKAYYPPRREWKVSLDNHDHACGRVSFTTSVNGKRAGWMIQGPIARIHG